MDHVLGNHSLTSYRSLGDETVVAQARQGDSLATEYLLSKYKGLVEGKARSYFLAGADHEDVVQEGMIGLFKAIRDYRTDRLAGFRAFAEICVTRQIITAVKSATRQKHIPLNHCISLHGSDSDGDASVALIDVLPNVCVTDPEKSVLEADVKECLQNGVDSGLSSLESQVLGYYVQGMTYGEMAKLLSKPTKSIDNALQRAKRKIGEKIAKE
ncbi:MAG TPA: RNA polymerase sporulation sigma factor SigH [Armatimonadota bacterium]|jgi:RNA polymerase sporulation-specific sigma factor